MQTKQFKMSTLYLYNSLCRYKNKRTPCKCFMAFHYSYSSPLNLAGPVKPVCSNYRLHLLHVNMAVVMLVHHKPNSYICFFVKTGHQKEKVKKKEKEESRLSKLVCSTSHASRWQVGVLYYGNANLSNNPQIQCRLNKRGRKNNTSGYRGEEEAPPPK